MKNLLYFIGYSLINTGTIFGGQINRHERYFQLNDGDVIKLKDVFIFEWSPKLPGRIWTTEGITDFREGQRRVNGYVRFKENIYAILDPYGKSKVVSAGFGSIRLNRKKRDEDNYMLLALVSTNHWLCDYGIPVVVSKAVYEKYLNYSKNGAPWLKSVEGILHINQEVPFAELIPRALGASLSSESEETLRYRPALPKCYIHISSPLQIKFTYNDSNPEATAWTMFETRYKEDRLRYTYTKFDPMDNDSIDEAISFINWYVSEYGGTRIITDFDGQVPRLESSIPIDKDPLRSNKVEAKRLIRKCDRWIRTSLKRFKE